MKTATTQTSAAVMVVLLCFTVFKGSWSNQEDEEAMLHGNLNEDFDYTTPPCEFKIFELLIRFRKNRDKKKAGK